MANKPEVTKADECAAADFLKVWGVPEIKQSGPLARAFAAHREQSTAALQAEISRLREELAKAKNPQWFYYGDECSSDRCRFSVYECIDEDFLYENSAEGDHVVCISGARPVPDIWVALRFFTEEEKDARDSDDDFDFTEHATEEEARAALTKENQDD